MTNSECRVLYAELGDYDEPLFYARVHEGNPQVHHRRGLAGEWTKLGNWETIVFTGGGVGDQFKGLERLHNG